MKPLRNLVLLRSEWAWFAAICLFALVLRLPIATISLERDEGEYAYIGQRWLQHEIPYSESFNQKFPGTFVAYALIQRTLGTSSAAIHWGAQIYSLGTLALLFLLGRHLSGTVAGLAAAAFAAVMIPDPGFFGNAANTEVFMILPLAGAMLAACYAIERNSPGWAFGAGCLGAGAILFKQVALPSLVFHLFAITLLTRRRTASATMLLLGAACVIAPVVAYFAVHGALADFYEDTIRHNLGHASVLQLKLYPVRFWAGFRESLRSLWAIMLLAVVQVVRELSSLIVSRAPIIPTRWRTLLALGWLGAGVVGTTTGGYFQPHYFIQTIPPIALLAGMAVASLQRSRPEWVRRAMIFIQVTAVVLPITIAVSSNTWYYLPGDAAAKTRHIYSDDKPFVEAPDLGRFLAEHSDPRDTIFILGSEPQILYYAERRSASRYIFVYPLTAPIPGARQRQLEALSEIRRSDPRFIVTVFTPDSCAAENSPMELFDGIREMLNESYRIAGVIGFTQSGTTQFLSGEEAEAAWQRSPIWLGMPSWCMLAVWEHVRPAHG